MPKSRFRLRDREKMAIIRRSLETCLHEKRGSEMESAAEALVEPLKQLPVRLMRDNVKEERSAQLVMAQLAFDKNYTLLENCWEIVTDVGENGKEDPVLDSGGNVQYERDDNGERAFSCNLSEEKKAMFMEIVEWKSKEQSVSSNAETTRETIQRSVATRETARGGLNQRVQNINTVRNNLKRAIEKEIKQNEFSTRVESQYKRAMASAAFTTAQSAKLMVSTLLALLAGNMESTSMTNGSVDQSQQELSTMASSISDPGQIVISPTPDNSRDGPFVQPETSTPNDNPTIPNDNLEHLPSTAHVEGSDSMSGTGGGHVAD